MAREPYLGSVRCGVVASARWRRATRELIRRFYAAFDARDGDAMAASYAPDARFSDPVFADLRGEEPGAMWRMLTGRRGRPDVELVEHEAEGDRGSARWLAHYTFTQTGRRSTTTSAPRFASPAG